MCSLSDETKLKLHHVTEDRDKLKKEKEEQYQTLMQKIKSVEQAYESILQVGSLPYSIGGRCCKVSCIHEYLSCFVRALYL